MQLLSKEVHTNFDIDLNFRIFVTSKIYQVPLHYKIQTLLPRDD